MRTYLLISILFLLSLSWQAVAQEDTRLLVHKKSRLRPAVLNLAHRTPKVIINAPAASRVTAKKIARTNVQSDSAPSGSKIFDPYAVSNLSVAESKPEIMQKYSASKSAPGAASSIALWIGAALFALTSTSLILFFFFRTGSSNNRKVSVSALEQKPIVMMVPRKYEPVIKNQEFADEIEFKQGHEPSLVESVKNNPRNHGEIDLVMALQGLKLKHQIEKPSVLKVHGKTKRRSHTEAKKLGIGIGEIDLAYRLERLSEHKPVEGGRI